MAGADSPEPTEAMELPAGRAVAVPMDLILHHLPISPAGPVGRVAVVAKAVGAAERGEWVAAVAVGVAVRAHSLGAVVPAVMAGPGPWAVTAEPEELAARAAMVAEGAEPSNFTQPVG